MKITKIIPQKKNPSRFNLYVDGIFKCGVGATTIALNNLYVSKELSETDIEQIIDNEIYNRFYDRAVTYVTNALKTEKAVVMYLKRLYHKKKKDWIAEDVVYDIDSAIARVINRLKELGLLSDIEFASAFVDSRQFNKPRSKYMLVNELIVKGVDPVTAKRTVESLSDEELIYDLYIKKYGERKFDINEDSKIVRFLAGKGFSWD